MGVVVERGRKRQSGGLGEGVEWGWGLGRSRGQAPPATQKDGASDCLVDRVLIIS